MTGVEILSLVVIFFSFVVGLLCFGAGFAEYDKDKGFLVIFLGVFFLVVGSVIASVYTFDKGSLFPADNGAYDGLREGVYYENIHSEEGDKSFCVWVRWNNKQRNALFILKENPPEKFVYVNGRFVSVINPAN